METFAEQKQFVENPQFEVERKRAIDNLSIESIDEPVRGIIEGFAKLPYCFTLQCCYGHFVYAGQPEPENLDRLPEQDVGDVTYRIAYVALCVRDNAEGRRLVSALAEIPSIDPGYVQFGSPDWFWQRHVNSFALQVEPARFAYKDQAIIEHSEALRVQKVRDQFVDRLGELVQSLRSSPQ